MRFLHTTIRFLLLGWVIPCVLGLMVYYGFVTNYTSQVFSHQGFVNQYENGIYKYRMLGREALLEMERLVKAHGPLPLRPPASLRLLDRAGDPDLYAAYFLLNTLFLCLTCSVLFVAFHQGGKAGEELPADLAVLASALVMAITQYVVVPYDTLSYFFLALGIALSLHPSPGHGRLGLLALATVLGTLTRETAALIPAFFFALHHREILVWPFGDRPKRRLLQFLLVSAAFLAAYLALRLYFRRARPDRSSRPVRSAGCGVDEQAISQRHQLHRPEGSQIAPERRGGPALGEPRRLG